MANVFGLPGRFRPTDNDFGGYSGPPSYGGGSNQRVAGRPTFGLNFSPEDIEASSGPADINLGNKRTGKFGYKHAGDFFGGRRSYEHRPSYLEANFANPLDPLRKVLSDANPQASKGKAMGSKYNPNDPFGQLDTMQDSKYNAASGMSSEDIAALNEGRFGSEDLMNRIRSADLAEIGRLESLGTGLTDAFQQSINNLNAQFQNPEFTRERNPYVGKYLHERSTSDRGGAQGSSLDRETDALKQAYFNLQNRVSRAGGL